MAFDLVNINIILKNKYFSLIFLLILVFTLLSSVSAMELDDSSSLITLNDDTADLSPSKNSNLLTANEKAYISTSSIYTVSSKLSNDEIQAIFDSSQNGDTIQFNDKSYDKLSIIVDKQLNIISSSNAKITASNELRDRAKELSIANTFAFYLSNLASGTVIKGLNFVGGSDYPIMASGANNITLSNNNISNAKKAGIYIENSSYDKLKSNTVRNCYDGMVFNGLNRSNISLNNVYSNRNTGIILNSSAVNNLSKNKIYKNGLDGVLIEDSKLNKVLNNSITDNKVSGLRLEGKTRRNTIQYNNISSNVVNIYANSETDNDIIIQNTLMFAKAATNTYTSDDNTGSAICFADNYTAAKAGTMLFAYNTIGFNEFWDAKSTMNHPAVDIGSNWYFDNDGNYAIGHICPMVFGGYLSPEDLKHLSMGFSTDGKGIIGQLFDGSSPCGAGSFTIDNINIDGVDYGSAEVSSDGSFNLNLDNVKLGSKVTVTVNGHSFTVDVDNEIETNSSSEEPSIIQENNQEKQNIQTPSPNYSQKTGDGNGSGTGSKTGTGSGEGNFTGSGVAVGAESGESNSGTGVSGDNGGGSASEGITAYEISKKTSATAAKNSQLIAVAAVVFVILIIALGYRSKNKDDEFNDKDYKL